MNAVDVLILNGKGLTVEEVAEVTLKGRKVEIAEEAFGRLKKRPGAYAEPGRLRKGHLWI